MQIQNSHGDLFEIRRPTESDIAAALDIAEIAWQPIYAGFREALGDEIYFAYYPDWCTTKRSHIERLMHSEHSYVTVENGRVIGFCSFTVSPETKTGTVMDNAVLPDCRGRGIGVMQNEFVFSQMRSLGIAYVCVHTGLDDAHAPARRAYEHAGFDHSIPQTVYYKKL